MGRLPDNGLGIAVILWVMLRVAVVVAIWLLLFLMLFLGYITVPLLVLGGFTLVWTVLHLPQTRRLLAGLRRRVGGR